MSKSLWIVILILVLGGGYLFLSGGLQSTVEDDTLVTDEVVRVVEDEAIEDEDALVNDDDAIIEDGEEAMEDEDAIMEEIIISYTDSGFDPANVSVKAGTTVTFKNESSGVMWIASAIHPTHQLLPEFNQLEEVSNGGEYSFVFDGVGTWKFHNHRSPSITGAVTVTE